MSANHLLLWMSAREAGSWQQFRAAVEELRVGEQTESPASDDEPRDQLALAVYQLLRLNLQRLGHAEFFAPTMSTDWRVAPPTLATTQHPEGELGVVAGARSTKLLERLQDSAGPLSLRIETSPDWPDAIRVLAPNRDALRALADRARLLLQGDAAGAILTSLPAVDEPGIRRKVELPFGAGWRIERFVTKDLRWHVAGREEALATSGALFRFSLRHQRHVLFCASGAAFQVPGQVGKYLALRHDRRRRVLTYSSATRRLTVPASGRPPFLVERALVVCSGLLPDYEAATGLLHYHDVPAAVALVAAALLRQELR